MITLKFVADGIWRKEKISLDLQEEDSNVKHEELRTKYPTSLWDMVYQDPVAACKCFEFTVTRTLQDLSNMKQSCAPKLR